MAWDCLEGVQTNNQEGAASSGAPVMITADKRGPYHTILKLGYHGKIHELLKSNDNEVLKVYATKLLPHVVAPMTSRLCVLLFYAYQQRCQ